MQAINHIRAGARCSSTRPVSFPGARVVCGWRRSTSALAVSAVSNGSPYKLEHAAVVAADTLQPALEASSAVAAEAPFWQPIMSMLSRAAMCLGLVAAFMLASTGSAFAARTGGRVGGQSFSRSVASRTQARSMPTPRSSSYSPGSSTTIIHTGPSLGMSSFFFPFGGYGYGHSVGGGGGSLLLTLMLTAVVALLAIQAFSKLNKGGMNAESDDEEGHAPVTVAKVQVGLLAIAKDLKADLNLLAARANTSTPEGLHLIMQETVLALMRNPDYCVYGASSSQLVAEPEDAERIFNTLSMEERSKFKEETLVNFGGISRSSTMASKASDGVAELIVVNLMVAAEGELQIPSIRSQADLKLALTKLGSIPPSDVMAVELLWTPQADNDTMTRQDCLVQYPNLAPL